MNLLHKQEDQYQRSEPLVDFVLKFQAIPAEYFKSKKRVPAHLIEERTKEYIGLIRELQALKLRVTSRIEPDNKGFVLIFVSAPDELLAEIREKERVNDFLSGVVAVRELNRPPTSFTFGALSTLDGEVISPADRIRYVNYLLTNQPGISRSTQPRMVNGAGLKMNDQRFPHLVDMIPLHHQGFNSAWIRSWSNVSWRSVWMGIGDREIDRLRFHFGAQVALYFAFLNMYFTSLAPAAILGLLFWLRGELFSPMYSAVLTLWACMFVEVWRMRERKFAVRWGMTGVKNVTEPRPEFRPHEVVDDPVTHDKVEVFEWWRRELRMILSLPIVLLFVALLAGAITLNFLTEIILGEIYEGPGKQVVTLVPTILFSICIPAIQAAWHTTASFLTRYENHSTVSSFNSSLTLKMFGLQCLVPFAGIVLTAYIYIPFGERLMGTLFERGYLTRLFQFVSRQPNFQMPTQLNFEVKPARLNDQLFALCVTSQLINTFTETLVPIILRAVSRWKERLVVNKSKGALDKKERRVSFTHDQAEKRFLSQVQAEFLLPTYDLFVDYAEMATQFGGIVLWSTIWPLAPVMGYVNNWFEIRSDAFKIVTNMRRPVPKRAETIGTWLEVLAFIARVAVLTNASLVYLFQAHPKSGGWFPEVHTTLRTELHPPSDAKMPCVPSSQISTVMPSFLPRSGTSAALVASLIVAMVCELIYQVICHVVKHVLTRLLWRDSLEERALRRMQHEIRVSLLDRLEKSHDSSRAHQTKPLPSTDPIYPDRHFWDQSQDEGMSYFASANKAD
ncbi:hypothetical protein MPSI1_002641 [Malassezia psittaci]|uniref:Protein required for meiotic chromosome segregation n=1 Tax=Malassezia psittaci TaxID=1821823 RepID=A0AAF0FCZ6_9BASI|nr:hypothetical protein MPSI1_002641 [Malassezia psittaci]